MSYEDDDPPIYAYINGRRIRITDEVDEEDAKKPIVPYKSPFGYVDPKKIIYAKGPYVPPKPEPAVLPLEKVKTARELQHEMDMARNKEREQALIRAFGTEGRTIPTGRQVVRKHQMKKALEKEFEAEKEERMKQPRKKTLFQPMRPRAP